MNEGGPKPISNPSPEHSFEDLARKNGLLAGKKVTFEKIAAHEDSAVKTGTVMSGVLGADVKKGQPIRFSDTAAVISNVADLKEENGDIYLTTATSTYKIVPERKSDGFVDVADVESVVTAKGSQYNYLPDGTTQRFKKVENKNYDPQTALVYIPDYEWIQKNADPRQLSVFGDNPGTYEENLLAYIQGKDKNCYLVDKDGNKLETNEKLRTAQGPIFLTFGAENKADFMIPVSVNPKIGYYTYDSRKYKDEKTGNMMRERHMGNQVVQINLKKK